jgi:crotonobetainyl-CoA:carnitine CoA-transferase CaiB-like acyl-CoA transferase
MNKQEPLMLSPFRALDLTDEKGFLCGQFLGYLGVDVIKIEPPGGDSARNLGPFYHSTLDRERSLYWFAYNLNKRGITLNIETDEGKKLFKKLCKTADFVIESFPVGYLDKLELGYPTLNNINSRIIMTSITPFGQTGPYQDFKASDIVGMAMGGLMHTTGPSDRAPLRISFPQAYLNAGIAAAMATMVAHYYRQNTGEGQHVDTSMQASIAVIADNLIPQWQLSKLNVERMGIYFAGRTEGGAKQRLLWQCKDGYVLFLIIGGPTGIKTNKAITEWMDSEGMAPEYMVNVNWDTFSMADQTPEFQERLEEPIAKFFMSHTKSELYKGAVERQLMLYPVSSPEDILGNVQLQSRDFWTSIEHPELKTTIRYPGFPVQSSETSFQIRRRSPLIGEHNQDIYRCELGLSKNDLANLEQANVI